MAQGRAVNTSTQGYTPDAGFMQTQGVHLEPLDARRYVDAGIYLDPEHRAALPAPSTQANVGVDNECGTDEPPRGLRFA